MLCILFFASYAGAITFPAVNAPEVQWDRYFRWFGQQEKDKQVQANPASQMWTNAQWAAFLAGKVGNKLASEGYLPNTDLEGRMKGAVLDRYSKGRCEHCVKNVGAALTGAKIPHQTMIAVRSHNRLDVNNNHSWIVVEEKPGSRSYYAIDLWLHGREKGTFANMASTPLASANFNEYWKAMQKESYKRFQREGDKGTNERTYASVGGFVHEQFEMEEQERKDKAEKRLDSLLQLKYGKEPFRASSEMREIQKRVRSENTKITTNTERKTSNEGGGIDKKQAAEQEEEIDVTAVAAPSEQEMAPPHQKRKRGRIIDGETEPVPEIGTHNEEAAPDEEAAASVENTEGKDEGATETHPLSLDFDGQYQGADKIGNPLHFTVISGVVKGTYWHIEFEGKVTGNGHIQGKGKGVVGEYTGGKQPESESAVYEYGLVGDISGTIAIGEVEFMMFPQGKREEAVKGTSSWSVTRQE